MTSSKSFVRPCSFEISKVKKVKGDRGMLRKLTYFENRGNKYGVGIGETEEVCVFAGCLESFNGANHGGVL